MNKQQLQHLEEEIKAGTTIHDEYSPTLAPFPSAPYEYAIDWFYSGPHAGQYLLDLVLWSDYYHYHATREQPEEKGWATQEGIAVWSPFLSEILSTLEDRGIPLPTIRPTPLPSPAQQVSASAIARGLGGAGA